MDILDEVKALEEAVAVLKRVDLNPLVYGIQGVEVIDGCIQALASLADRVSFCEQLSRKRSARSALETLIARGGKCDHDSCLPGCPIACVSEMSDEDVLRLARERLAELDRR